MRTSRPTARTAAVLLATTLVLPLAACGDSSAQEPTASATSAAPAPSATQTPAVSAPEDVAKAALAWLAATELTDGLFVTEFDGTAYPDQGLTLDVLVAALAAGDDALAQKLAGAFTVDVVDAYAGDGESAGYAGSTAKGAVVLGAADNELATTLDARLATLLTESGRISDLGGDDYSSTVSQAWGVLALSRPAALASDDGAERATHAATYLVSQQCDDGSFPAVLDAEECVGDVDSTAFALSALTGYTRSGATDLDEAVTTQAASWLAAAATEVDGGRAWVTGEPAVANTNSAGVALVALTDAASTDPVVGEARAWLASQTVPAGDGLAITFDGTAPDARASAQAVPALLGFGLFALVGSEG